MRAFTEPLTQLQGYEELEQAVQKTEGVILVSGCIDAVKPHIVYSVHNGSGNRIIVTFHEQKAKELLEEYRFFDKNVAYYPAKDILFYQSDIRGNVLTSERINALKMMAEEKECTIITTFDGLKKANASTFTIPFNRQQLADYLSVDQIGRASCRERV